MAHVRVSSFLRVGIHSKKQRKAQGNSRRLKEAQGNEQRRESGCPTYLNSDGPSPGWQMDQTNRSRCKRQKWAMSMSIRGFSSDFCFFGRALLFEASPFPFWGGVEEKPKRQFQWPLEGPSLRREAEVEALRPGRIPAQRHLAAHPAAGHRKIQRPICIYGELQHPGLQGTYDEQVVRFCFFVVFFHECKTWHSM